MYCLKLLNSPPPPPPDHKIPRHIATWPIELVVRYSVKSTSPPYTTGFNPCSVGSLSYKQLNPWTSRSISTLLIDTLVSQLPLCIAAVCITILISCWLNHHTYALSLLYSWAECHITASEFKFIYTVKRLILTVIQRFGLQTTLRPVQCLSDISIHGSSGKN
jgi:hypothetical protein